ncbi:hypothetical protein SBRCBS47491_009644 [Sporothrix bragantina]|uniref:Uncharacterized protein n=1 Tax=Sporothrix bragantina TaxID=671064 RepID=A0ABP0CY32_9PEZI
MPISASSPRRLATSAQVYPKFLTYMHAPKPLFRGPAMRRLPACAAVACIGYAVASHQIFKKADSGLASQDSHLSEDRTALLDAYGGRDSLEELEMAARVYEAQRNQARR